MKRADPIRLWLQRSWTQLCSCDHCLMACQKPASPIEVMMINAIAFGRAAGEALDLWEFHHQWQVLSYTADLVILAEAFKIVIECDGHDYHERTKEQAAHDRKRDRAMTEAGYTVLRYTGSEIWRNPFECATQALSLAMTMQVHHDIRSGVI